MNNADFGDKRVRALYFKVVDFFFRGLRVNLDNPCP